jgi:hypothetical protein
MRSAFPLLLACAVIVLLGFSPERAVEGPFEYKFVRVKRGLVAENRFQEVPTSELGERVANDLAREGWVLDQIDSLWMGGPATRFEALTLVFRRRLP